VFGWREGVNGLSGDEYNDVFLHEDTTIHTSRDRDRDSAGAGSSANTTSAKQQQQQRVYVDSNCPYINACDPAHNTDATTYKLFGGATDSNGEPSNTGFVSYEKTNPDYCNVMSGFKPADLPIINALADEFAVMDRFFAAHPGPTWPNRMFTVSGTSAGSTETFAWYQDIDGQLFPQKTIFDQIGRALSQSASREVS
jgi:phospholipase C